MKKMLGSTLFMFVVFSVCFAINAGAQSLGGEETEIEIKYFEELSEEEKQKVLQDIKNLEDKDVTDTPITSITSSDEFIANNQFTRPIIYNFNFTVRDRLKSKTFSNSNVVGEHIRVNMNLLDSPTVGVLFILYKSNGTAVGLESFKGGTLSNRTFRNAGKGSFYFVVTGDSSSIAARGKGTIQSTISGF
ncbi:hypothetical protein [Alkalihalobacillus sp. LMS39]|uniref:hypothetical protein n=1 Tax=Alkalihalobacillus sp. LMS39 TaxID=2924032 RepID=UPI001FB5377B|nr:hypothetical protein [Alkalihalobacillus sp. LMS39]UOE96039.1 hypothetical protein MM271_10760 [Alkalihalobacillus sp. LMS39]